MIQHFAPNELRAGMTVATPVYDRDGRTLCAARAILTERVVARLRAMGLDSIAVLVDSPLEQEETARQIRHRFRRALDDPAMVELCEMFTRASLERPGTGATAREAPVGAAPESRERERPSTLRRFARACLGGGIRAREAVR